jgi:hypothetical protein
LRTSIAQKVIARALDFFVCLALIGCDKANPVAEAISHPMNKSIDFGIEAFESTIATLEPKIDHGPDGETRDEPWNDTAKFHKWLEGLELGEDNTARLIEIVPSVSIGMNHGPLLGIERFIKQNSDSDHKVLAAGFLIFATGPNGDFIVVDVRDGSGQAGWLPMAMICGMKASQVREHFVPTNPNLGDFLRASEEQWANVPKDWYDARDQKLKSN